MKQEIKNGGFKVGIDWGSSEGDKTGYAPYVKIAMVYGKPKWHKRLFKRKSRTFVGDIGHYTMTIDGVIYLYPAKKVKITSIRGIK